MRTLPWFAFPTRFFDDEWHVTDDFGNMVVIQNIGTAISFLREGFSNLIWDELEGPLK